MDWLEKALLLCARSIIFVDGFWLGAKFEQLKLSEASTCNSLLLLIIPLPVKHGRAKWTPPWVMLRGDGGYWNCPAEFFLPIIMEKVENPSDKYRCLFFLLADDVNSYEKRFLSFQNKIELANSLLLFTSLSWQRRQMLRIIYTGAGSRKYSDSRAFYPMPEMNCWKLPLPWIYNGSLLPDA